MLDPYFIPIPPTFNYGGIYLEATFEYKSATEKIPIFLTGFTSKLHQGMAPRENMDAH